MTDPDPRDDITARLEHAISDLVAFYNPDGAVLTDWVVIYSAQCPGSTAVLGQHTPPDQAFWRTAGIVHYADRRLDAHIMDVADTGDDDDDA